MLRPTNPIIDLDASRRELGGEPIPVRFGGQNFLLPVELPAAVFDPLLDGRLDPVLGLLGPLLAEVGAEGKEDLDILATLSTVLVSHPTLPRVLLVAARDVFAGLFGEEDWPRFLAGRPSLPDYFRLGKALWSAYGVSLGEALASSRSSATDGATSKPTFTLPASTLAAPGFPLRTPS